MTKIITIMTWNLSQDFARPKRPTGINCRGFKRCLSPRNVVDQLVFFKCGTYEFDNSKWRSDKSIINKDATFSVLVHGWFSLLSVMFSCGISGVFLG